MDRQRGAPACAPRPRRHARVRRRSVPARKGGCFCGRISAAVRRRAPTTAAGAPVTRREKGRSRDDQRDEARAQTISRKIAPQSPRFTSAAMRTRLLRLRRAAMNRSRIDMPTTAAVMAVSASPAFEVGISTAPWRVEAIRDRVLAGRAQRSRPHAALPARRTPMPARRRQEQRNGREI